ncbi:hypothetical protein BDR06DRAFT_414157 [Suillus hirtellus]|nr:hypothetical protein BDR06DRAFT_414157 [Suillus hirtellus]
MMVSTTCARLNDYCRDPGHRRASATSCSTPNSSTLLHCPLLTPTPCYCSCLIESTGTSHRHAPLHRPCHMIVKEQRTILFQYLNATTTRSRQTAVYVSRRGIDVC